jgi:hypothetical protein
MAQQGSSSIPRQRQLCLDNDMQSLLQQHSGGICVAYVLRNYHEQPSNPDAPPKLTRHAQDEAPLGPNKLRWTPPLSRSVLLRVRYTLLYKQQHSSTDVSKQYKQGAKLGPLMCC